MQNYRVVYLDSMRAILMLLVVCYHASLVFSPDSIWVINSQETTPAAYMISQFLGLFIMPLFFMISGYFALFNMDKYPLNQFILKRLRRILIPLFSTALTLNVIQSFVSKNDAWYEYYLDGGWISHLWFLWNLAIYFIVIYLIIKFIKFIKLKSFDLFFLKLNILSMMFLLPSFSIALLVLGKLLPATVIGISISSVLYHFPYFIFGILLYMRDDLVNKFVNLKFKHALFLILISYVLYNFTRSNNGIMFLTLGVYFQSLSAWLLSSLSFKIFYYYINKPSKMLTILSEASYSIYLFQQLLVVLFGYILIRLDIGGIIGLIALVLLVSFASLLIHVLLISKIRVLKFLYNGQ